LYDKSKQQLWRFSSFFIAQYTARCRDGMVDRLSSEQKFLWHYSTTHLHLTIIFAWRAYINRLLARQAGFKCDAHKNVEMLEADNSGERFLHVRISVSANREK
jgi:hypothetical protein